MTTEVRGGATGAHPKRADWTFAARVSFRDATDADITALVPMINAAYKARDAWLFGPADRIDSEGLHDEFAGDGATGIVAEVDGEIAGFAVLRRRGASAEFGLLATAPAHQGRGLARIILERAEGLARAAGCGEMRLWCIDENGLPPFYADLGYRVASSERGERWGSLQAFTLVEMTRRLAAAGPARPPDASLAAAVRFRAATPSDAAALLDLINQAYVREAWLLPAPRITESQLHAEIASARVIVAEHEGAIAGCVRVRFAEGGAWFGLLATAPPMQGRGLAVLLVGAAENVARDEGATSMRLDCAEELGLPPYYASLGYNVESREPGEYFKHKGPMTRVVMVKRLS